eukprot:COSAG01_NODE_2417_length_7736_cov_7.862511_2_plen_86_part_00
MHGASIGGGGSGRGRRPATASGWRSRVSRTTGAVYWQGPGGVVAWEQPRFEPRFEEARSPSGNTHTAEQQGMGGVETRQGSRMVV